MRRVVTSEAERLRRTVEVCVYAPIGVALWVRDLAPNFVNMFVARGRAEVTKHEEQVQRRLKSVRGAGEVALAFGVPAVRDRVRGHLHTAPDSGSGAAPATVARNGFGETRARVANADAVPGTAVPSIPVEPHVDQPSATTAAPAPEPRRDHTNGVAVNGTSHGASVDTLNGANALAIPGYDALSASQVVERLAGLDPEELSAIREYESAHRRRRTILGKIDQLAAG